MGMEGAMGHGAWTQETETLTKREQGMAEDVARWNLPSLH